MLKHDPSNFSVGIASGKGEVRMPYASSSQNDKSAALHASQPSTSDNAMGSKVINVNSVDGTDD